MARRGPDRPEDQAHAALGAARQPAHGAQGPTHEIGLYYGQGVPQNDVEAHLWFNLAAAQLTGEDRDLAVKNRDITAGRMTAEQVADAQCRAREWTPTPEP